MQKIGEYVLAVNTGSSSVKAVCFERTNQLLPVAGVSVENIGQSATVLRGYVGPDTQNVNESSIEAADFQDALDIIFDWFQQAIDLEKISAIGYRVVFSGPDFTDATVIDDAVVAVFESMKQYDPDHMPAILDVIQNCRQRFSGVVHVACFDTSFFADLPEVAKIIPLPSEYLGTVVRRYGFHGLSYTYLLSEVQQHEDSAASGKIIFAHLGSGVSLAAVKNGRPIDTTMSFSPASGVVMSTRSGDIDPGILLYLHKTHNKSFEEIDEILNRKSGLIGVSEQSADMYTLLKAEPDSEQASRAVELFCYQVRKAIGSLAGALGGVDMLVFSGGIGYRSASIRSRICSELGFLGIELDHERNTAQDAIISAEQSIPVRILQTNEEVVIAQQTIDQIHR